MPAVQVPYLEVRYGRGELVHCLEVDSTVPVLVPVGRRFHDVELDVGGKAAGGLPEHQWLGAQVGCGGVVQRLSCYAEE